MQTGVHGGGGSTFFLVGQLGPAPIPPVGSQRDDLLRGRARQDRELPCIRSAIPGMLPLLR